MTSKSLSCREVNRPILLRPAGKDYLWGGVRLRGEYHKDLPLEPLAETWECSTHPDGPSIIASGEYAGMTLREVLRQHPKWLGERHGRELRNGEQQHGKRNRQNAGGELPILIKLIDAAKDLSIQVHPADAYAWEHEGQPGKTEMWYVLDAEPGAELIYGFSHDVTGQQVREALEKGKLLNHVQKIPVRKNDVFFVEPGTLHAIGGGVLLAEIQENSNVTYRLYDYDRVDKNGQKRPLHLEKALDVLDLKRAGQVRQQLRLMRYQPGAASEILCRCEYFQVNRVLVTERFCFRVEKTSFQVLLVLEGELEVENLQLRKGDCVFLPAGCGELEVEGKGQLLQVFC